MNNIIDGAFLCPNVSFFDVIDKNLTIKLAKEKMCEFQKTWRKTHKSGGVVANTFDVFHALLNCIPPTMDDMRSNQPDVFLDSCRSGTFFAFIYRNTITSKMNNLKDACFANMRVSKETVYNQLNKLLEIGILVEKKNYKIRRKTVKGKSTLVNPLPCDLSPKGKGKIQLFFSPDVLKFKPKYEALFGHIKETLQQYRVNSLFLKALLKSTLNRANIVDKKIKASANAELNLVNVKNKEQERILQQQYQIPRRQFLQKKDFFAFQIYEKMRLVLNDGKFFHKAVENSSLELIQNRLELIEHDVRAYRAKKVKTYKEREKYKNAKLTTQYWMIERYKKKLPKTSESAVEILTFAIEKQAKHAANKNYSLPAPPTYLTSINFEKALGYSFSDWIKIQDGYFKKNKAYGAYCEELGKIGRIHLKVLDFAYNNIHYAYAQARQAYRNFARKIESNTSLTSSSKERLKQIFGDKVAPIFKNLSAQDKHRISLATK